VINYALRSFSAKHKYFPKLFNSFTFLADNKVTSLYAEILFEYGLNDVWLNQCVDSVENLLLKLKERIIGSFISEVTAFLENSPKCQKHVIITTLQYTIFSIQ
jgi:hypothetical protein